VIVATCGGIIWMIDRAPLDLCAKGLPRLQPIQDRMYSLNTEANLSNHTR
jgi:hypothetical protein